MFGDLQSRTGVCGTSSADRESSAQEDSSLKPTAILRNSRGLTLEIYNPVSKDMLQCILEVLSNAE